MIPNKSAVGAVIIGGGFSGTMVAAELARRGITSVLVDGSGRAGCGTAYSTTEEAHLLNVVAGRMGAWADRPDDFAKEVAAEGYDPADYVPRRRYGKYLSKILQDARASGLVTSLSSDAGSAESTAGGWVVRLADGSRVQGHVLVLAQGNQSPAPPAFARGIPKELIVNDPWSDIGRKAISDAAGDGGDVLIVGTGLTMVDVVLSLDVAAHRGRIIAVSRRGLAPRSHGNFDRAPVELDDVPAGSLIQLWRWLRQRSAVLGWRAAMDSLRPHSHALWQKFNEGDQQRFLRHARPWWDVHRHRIAPEVASRIRRLVEMGRLEILAGRVVDMWVADQKLSASIQRRGRSEPADQEFALAVNCTGPLGSISKSRDPLLNSLFAAGYARPDALDLGIDVDGRSRIIGAEHAWAVGPLSKGRFWEIVAVPDIREQVAMVAEEIVEELSNAVQP